MVSSLGVLLQILLCPFIFVFPGIHVTDMSPAAFIEKSVHDFPPSDLGWQLSRMSSVRVTVGLFVRPVLCSLGLSMALQHWFIIPKTDKPAGVVVCSGVEPGKTDVFIIVHSVVGTASPFT